MPRPHLPVGEQLRSTTRDPRSSVLLYEDGDAASCISLGPKDQISVQFAHGRVKRRAIISPVVLEPSCGLQRRVQVSERRQLQQLQRDSEKLMMLKAREATFGDRFRDYQKRVPAYVPFLRSHASMAWVTCGQRRTHQSISFGQAVHSAVRNAHLLVFT